jgi:hypothetical protein
MLQMLTRTGPQLGGWEGQCNKALERLGGALSASASSFVDAGGAQEGLLRALGEQLREAASRVSRDAPQTSPQLLG